jgi:pyrroline-5-carboxylate reductase
MNIGIIGYGSMGKMLFEKFIETNAVKQPDLFVSNRTYEKIMELNKYYPKVNVCKDNISVGNNVDILFICVKPLEIKPVLLEINNSIKENCHIVSLNGNVLFEQMERICTNKKITKIMPSVTAEVNKSVTLICHNNYVNNNDKDNIKKILECIGTVTEIPENEIGIGAELTSCMPGFIGAIFKVIADEAEKHTSINKLQIIQMITETMYGTSKILLEKGMSFDILIGRVATKGGITEEGTKIIMEKLPQIIKELFKKTLDKRKITTENAQKSFSEL